MLWSESSKEADSFLNPKLGFKKWSDLEDEDKEKILRHLRNDVLIPDANSRSDWKALFKFMQAFNRHLPRSSYATNIFDHGDMCEYIYGDGGSHVGKGCCINAIQKDLNDIFIRQDIHVVLEFLSLYLLLNLSHFQLYMERINKLFNAFYLDKELTRIGFVPKQEEIIQTMLTSPVLSSLTDKKWQPVNNDLSDALAEYHKNTPQSYSKAITCLVSSLQAFLQLQIKSKTGKGNIGELIDQGIKKKNGLLPDDRLSTEVMHSIESIIMNKRQQHSDAHPKEEYASEKSVRFVLNLVLIFMQRCLEDKSTISSSK